MGRGNIENQLQKNLADYSHHRISKQQFLSFFDKNRAQTKERLSFYIDSSFQKEGYDIAARIAYTKIISLPDSTDIIKEPIILYSTKNVLTKKGIGSTGSWQTSSTSYDDKKKIFTKDDSFKIESKTDFQILNIQKIVFQELALLIILCIFILASVLWLFILTVKNLRRQTRQIQVLHTIVDNISHEFKTPIATLKIASKALKKDFNSTTLPLMDIPFVLLYDSFGKKKP